MPDDGSGSGSQSLDRFGRERGHDDGLVSNNDPAELDGDCGHLCELPAFSMMAVSVASPVSSVKPTPCMVRCSHWSGISVTVGAVINADR
ncbi:hypothetical protein [Micromonospora sp. KC606]|uniref:hypothetical protein n=1 Tax=Micromonospora sp. KC606 TaxID=2530379 RepID=UPI001FB7F730|nr:hypothetical protein [Micromonospora sp. KC606]